MWLSYDKNQWPQLRRHSTSSPQHSPYMLFLRIAYLASKSTLSNQSLMSSLMATKHKLFPTTQLWSQYLKDIQTAITLRTFSMHSQKDIQTSNTSPRFLSKSSNAATPNVLPRLTPTNWPLDLNPSCLTAHRSHVLTTQSTFESLSSTSNGYSLASTSFATP